VNEQDVQAGVGANEMRFAAYRLAARELFGVLRTGDRRPLPPCVVAAIKRLFPDPMGQYVGFKPARR